MGQNIHVYTREGMDKHISMKLGYGDGDIELSPDGGDSVPQHPPWFTHRQRHQDHLP